eukprot:433106-Hanusia_phi.AAC.1
MSGEGGGDGRDGRGRVGGRRDGLGGRSIRKQEGVRVRAGVRQDKGEGVSRRQGEGEGLERRSERRRTRKEDEDRGRGQGASEGGARHYGVFKWTPMHLAAINDQAPTLDLLHE